MTATVSLQYTLVTTVYFRQTLTESLTVKKAVTAGEGLTAPDADLYIRSDSGILRLILKEMQYWTGSDNQTTNTELTFDADGKATFTLKDGQSMEILNIGEGVEYTVKEINLPDGFTSDAADNTKTGTVSGTDENNIVTFTNTYNVTPVTTDDLESVLAELRASQAVISRQMTNLYLP